MKKVSAILISVLLVIMSVPSISSRADGGSFFKAITSEIFVDTYGSQAATWCSPQFSRSESYFDNYHYTEFNNVSNLVVSPFDPKVIYVLGGFNAAAGNTQLTLIDLNEIDDTFSAVFTSSGITIKLDHSLDVQSKTVPVYLYRFDNYNTFSWILDQTGSATFYNETDQTLQLDDNYQQSNNKDPIKLVYPDENESDTIHGYCRVSSSYMTYMYYTNCKSYYSINELWNKYYSPTNDGNISNNFGKAMLNGSGVGLTDYLAGGFSSYFDGDGVVTPERPDDVVIEDNTNHLFLTNFDTGFCKPYSLNDLYRAGGGYAYFSYNFDSWINSHSSQYELHVQTTLNVDNTEYIYNTVKGLDLQGLNVFSLKELASSYPWEYENMLFVEYPDVLFNNYNRGYLYSMTYTNAYGDSSTNFISRALGTGGRSNRLFYSSNGSTRQLTSSQPDSNIENIWVGEERTKFLITFDIVLYDTISQESSDHFTETHNLITGTSTVSSNGISDNKNPFENYNGDDPYLPVDDSGGGYSVSQSYGYVNNINIPSNYTVTYRDGVNTFIDWYNQDPSSTGIMNSFWGMMGVFRNNPATDIYEDYWGFLPSGFKNLVIACASLGIIGFAATVLRKRMMR